MTVNQIRSTAGAGVYFVMGVPAPWPPLSDGILMEETLSDGSIVVFANTEGRVIVQLFAGRKREKLLHKTATPPIRLGQENIISMNITVHDHRISSLVVGGILKVSIEGTSDHSNGCIINFDHPPEKVIDYSEQNEKFRTNRHHTFQGFNPTKEREEEAPQHWIEILSQEAAQIETLLKQIGYGNNELLPSLISRLRILLVDDKKRGLLQRCASFNSLPLIVYTETITSQIKPMKDANLITSSISATQDRFFCNPVDIDIWLDLTGMLLGLRKHSNREILWNIGSNLGAHRGNKAKALIAAIKSAKLNDDFTHGALQPYFGQIANAGLSLSRNILSHYKIN